ncbi:hypothetical protein PUN28_008463 [Cardiocondyla obscurior]|uniref:Uncharacterized protein n=1 Tax=Cardiocondyla obscurior TaxID=286306 RepID=A0AAW2FXU3_9HYME
MYQSDRFIVTRFSRIVFYYEFDDDACSPVESIRSAIYFIHPVIVCISCLILLLFPADL